MRPGLLALGLVAALVGSSCQYLLGYDPYAFPDDLEEPTPVATFESGNATIAIEGGPTVELPALTGRGGLYRDLGTQVTFTSGDGWYLTFSDLGGGVGLGFGSSAYLQFDRIVDDSHWTVIDPSRCITTVEAADTTGIRGTATCKGLRWSDMFESDFMSLEPSYVEGEDAFDAEITFEAVPGPSQS